MNVIDVRTDTSSLPTDEMREAMRRADVGNDGFGEDPTVNRLERMAAEMLGFELGLFVSSGTMGNLLGVMAGIHRGDAILIGSRSHIALIEGYSLSQLGGIYPIQVDDSSGSPDVEEIEGILTWRRMSERIRMVTVENTHNMRGGAAMRPGHMATFVDLVRRHHLKLHLDGARIFNAAVALGVDVQELTEGADSVTFCLSKGLCAPVGSVLVSDRETIRRARHLRNLMGGQMRQVGVLAAAGIVALERMIPRLADDHAKAKRLAAGLSTIPGIRLTPERVETNLVIFDVSGLGVSAAEFAKRLAEEGVLGVAFSKDEIRYAVYRDVTEEDIEPAVEITQRVAGEIGSHSKITAEKIE
ncbi:MAG: DegT/DnrJ/EryC1/StrS family aminotransferase [Candidatus Latescibacteria bacterium]|nr:DegT/DnrJ/EryC1/StrS family aminotransferase [Candidatus Latescibacterota bacterium]